MNKPVIIINASSIGRAALGIFKSNHIVVYGFLDDDKTLHGTEVEDVTVLGSTDNKEFLNIIGKDCDVFIASDDNKWKSTMIKSLRKQQKSMPVNAIHSSANVSESAIIHHGSLINQGVMIGAGAEIGNHCLAHTGVIIDYNVRIGDFVQLGAGCIINSGAVIEDGAFIGSGANIIGGVTVKSGARVGAGSVVISDVNKNETLFGNPATPIKK